MPENSVFRRPSPDHKLSDMIQAVKAVVGEHNPKVVGSNPTPATIIKQERDYMKSVIPFFIMREFRLQVSLCEMSAPLSHILFFG